MRTKSSDPRVHSRLSTALWALAVPLTALSLSGCPLYLDDNGPSCELDRDCPAGRACTTGRCVIPPECTIDTDCPGGEICTAGTCDPGVRTCRTDGDCMRGLMCDTLVCDVSTICSTDAECPIAGFWCDFRDTCVPRPAGACRTMADCTGGDRCVENACVPVEETCQFDRECVGGTSCVNAECTVLCAGASDCGNGDACTTNFCQATTDECATSATCGAGENCVAGRCLADCRTSTTACDPTEHCAADQFCRPDWEPTPVCTLDTDCAAGRVCRSGVCRTPCTAAASPSTTCTMIDGTLPNCRLDAPSGDFLCFATVEAMPECRTSDDCTGGRACVNATCRSLP